MARLRKRKKRSELDRIRREKVEVILIINRATASGCCSKQKMNKFLARWHDLCSQELRAMVEAAKARKAAAA
ncbi:MAG: hypothetical protein WC373_15240 [Smithella sp.]|jgi:outer membrane murein-binding lipoprotein Lpp